MFDLPDHWVWDFWTCQDDDGHTHLFFLHAPRSLLDPELRHRSASVGHAVSEDLQRWTRLPDALVPQPEPAYDDLAVWTGSVVRGPDGRWWMFTSGISRDTDGQVQAIGASWSIDLMTWTRTDLVLEADPRWYAVAEAPGDEEHWRDPCVLVGDDGRWHMYLTAKAAGAGPRGNGVVGHAVSQDLRTWEVLPPVSAPSIRFDQLEVVRVVEVEDRTSLIFSCLGPEIPGGASGDGGVWSVPFTGTGVPVDLDRAVRLTSEDLYVGDVARTGPDARFLAFENRGPDGSFQGVVTDPLSVTWRPDGAGLQLVDVPDRYLPSTVDAAPVQ